MDNASENSNSRSQKLAAEIKKTWEKLTPEEIGFQIGSAPLPRAANA